MNVFRRLMGLALLLTMAAVSEQAQIRSGTQTNPQGVRQLLRRIDDRIDLLRNSLTATPNRNPVSNNRDQRPVYNSREQNDPGTLLANLSEGVQQFRLRLNQREATAADAQQILDRASELGNFISRRSGDAQTERYWSNLQVDLNELARTYGLTWTQTGRGNRGYRNPPSAFRLTGTYRLDSTRTEDPGIAIDRALRSLPYQDRQQRREQLLRRLDPPNQIAIDVRGRTVTLASTRAAQVSFEADGREQTETTNSGRTIRVRSELTGNQLTVTTTGDRNTEFNVIFSPVDNGGLRVTRRVYAEGLNTPIEIQSFYEKTADVAQFDVFSGPQNIPSVENNGEFILRNGETVVAELNDPISTSTTRDGDTFTATVRSPTQYAGAVIEGHVSNIQRSGRVTGRSELTFSFDRIRLREGQSYRFAGILDSVRMPNGDSAKIDNEGAIQEDSQSQKTVQRTAIGTAVGAIIGAIAGGGKGAAIGAVVGAGGGAGSVYVQGRNDLDLPRGTEITIRTTGPNR
ncbi:MAG: hypothetical protein JWM21_178 [Acidobacteria bacterium]|nr:hypothetical protein [Acidobacteriota bacterium]